MTSEPAARPPLDRDRLAELTAATPDLVVEVLEEAASTNAVVAERARAGAADGLVVVADHQTGGRGRLDRTWVTPAATAVTFSMLLRPQAPTRSWPWLPLMTGYAVDKALKGWGLAAGVKWPNDVLVEERKVAGILVERVETPDGPAAVAGVGLNVLQGEDELPVPGASSLALAGGRDWDRTEVLIGVLESLRETYDAWEAGGDMTGMRLADSYAASCVTVGQQVRVDLPDGRVLEGRAEAIDPTGQLVVATAAGREAVGAGDVVHVRPT